MPTQPYMLDGKRLPSVTTIIHGSLGWSRDALMAWAWRQGKAGLDYKATTAQAAEAGTIAHELMDADIKGTIAEGPFNLAKRLYPDAQGETLSLSLKSYENYCEWKQGNRLEVYTTELPLVSREHRFGGCLDRIVRLNGKLAILDLKTSNGLYSDYLIQVAAYTALWNENRPDEPLDGGYHLLRIDKQNAAWAHMWWGELPLAWEAFLHLRALHDMKYKLKV